MQWVKGVWNRRCDPFLGTQDRVDLVDLAAIAPVTKFSYQVQFSANGSEHTTMNLVPRCSIAIVHTGTTPQTGIAGHAPRFRTATPPQLVCACSYPMPLPHAPTLLPYATKLPFKARLFSAVAVPFRLSCARCPGCISTGVKGQGGSSGIMLRCGEADATHFIIYK